MFNSKPGYQTPTLGSYLSYNCCPAQNQETASFLPCFNKHQDPPYTKKTRSYKKHFHNNLHDFSQLKMLVSANETPKLDTSHDKLDIKDIAGASPNVFHNEIFRNRIYGKKIDRKSIFDNDKNSLLFSRQMKAPIHNLPPLLEEKQRKRTEISSDYSNNIYRLPKSLHFDHVMDVRYSGEQKIGIPGNDERRRIKTELENPQFHIQQSDSLTRQLRRWSPTFLTENSNPLLLKMFPKIK